MPPSEAEHSMAMIALVPSDADLDRLTLPSGEARDELHLTLWFLGEATTYDSATRRALVNSVSELVARREIASQPARAFGVAHWNPASADPAWVLNVGDLPTTPAGVESLTYLRTCAHDALHETNALELVPTQHSPWQPHVCLAYSTDDLLVELEGRLGDLTFDKVRVAFGNEITDVALAQPATVVTSSGGDRVPWHKVHEHSDCPAGRPWAVVKDATGEVEGCHASEGEADDQLAALYASERDATGTTVAWVAGPDLSVTTTAAGTFTLTLPRDDAPSTHLGSTGGSISDRPWDGSASRFTDEQYHASSAGCDPGDEPPKSRCFLPHHEPGGAVSRAGVHAAAARFNQLKGHSAEAVARAKSHLRAHYRQLGEEVPDVLQADDDVVTLEADVSYGCPPGQHKMPDGSCMSDEEMTVQGRWFGVLAVEGMPTGDGREFAPGALSWADAPLLRWQKEGAHGGEHDVTVTVGRIDEVWRDGNRIMGRGVLDLASADGWELFRRLQGGFAGGISIDADDIAEADVEFVWSDDLEDESEDVDVVRLLFGSPEKMIFHGGRIRAATCVDIPAFVEACIGLGEVDDHALVASVATESNVVPRHVTATSDEPWTDRGRVTPSEREAYAWVSADRRLLLHHEVDDGVVGPANLTACAVGIAQLNGERDEVDVPFVDRWEAYEHLAAHLRDAGREPPLASFDALLAVNASVAVDDWRPPRSWFQDPKFSVYTGITVTDQGRVYGHIAPWGECHIGFVDECITPPFEEGHPYFMTGELVCADGTRAAVGQVTLGTGHAPLHYRASHAAEHYDNTGVAVADVVVGNDSLGIWCAGAVRPTVVAARVHELRASGRVSGDWRRIGGQLRLVGVLAVNVPGFPIPQLRARVASGAAQALIAAGVHMVLGNTGPTEVRRPTDEELNQLAMRRVMDMLVARMRQVPETEGAQ